jgi:hypothetical protein
MKHSPFFNKDGYAIITLLAALLLMTVAVLYSATVTGAQGSVATTDNAAQAAPMPSRVESIVVTATRLR